MVTSSLIDVKEVFKRLSPAKVSDLLLPGLDGTILGIAEDLGVGWALASPGGYELGEAAARR